MHSYVLTKIVVTIRSYSLCEMCDDTSCLSMTNDFNLLIGYITIIFICIVKYKH